MRLFCLSAFLFGGRPIRVRLVLIHFYSIGNERGQGAAPGFFGHPDSIHRERSPGLQRTERLILTGRGSLPLAFSRHTCRSLTPSIFATPLALRRRNSGLAAESSRFSTATPPLPRLNAYRSRRFRLRLVARRDPHFLPHSCTRQGGRQNSHLTA